ncbi:TadE family protein [Kitasatospora kifunensis]|uniref:Flp pilus assembly protein TadG n=1 Tax=Kitasatospora kifunensis TaxID=58351 RepID=A0A7W7RA89_KITKI|nr:TadE family protein [Kitasatospora kifunensis]MBB4928266.1 Flp pilus assembly protein TadG [Kitasatospora kifunensis]
MPRPPRLLSQVRARLARAGGDRGALSLELAIVFPLVMTTIFAAITVGLWYHARDVALSAAQRGVETARVQGAGLGQGLSVTRDFLDRAGGSISARTVSGSDGATVRIEVTGRVDTWIPGLSLPIDQHAAASRERVTATP